MSLTAKQEKFAQLVAQGKDHTAAYRIAYDTKNMKDETIWNKAYELSKHGEVSARIGLLKKRTEKRNEITLDQIVEGLKKAEAIASTKQDASNIRGAWMDIAKVTGNIVDKKEIKGDITLSQLLEELDA